MSRKSFWRCFFIPCGSISMIIYLILNLYIFCQVNDDNENTLFEFVWAFLTEPSTHFAGGFQQSGILSGNTPSTKNHNIRESFYCFIVVSFVTRLLLVTAFFSFRSSLFCEIQFPSEIRCNFLVKKENCTGKGTFILLLQKN